MKKLMNDYGIGAIIVLFILAYGVYMFADYLGAKGLPGSESNSRMGAQYKSNASQSSGVMPSEPNGHNEVFASANGIQTSMPGMPTSCSNPNIQNPADLLPKDTNSQWAQLNPSGKGELANINLLKAGYHIGIDTVGQSLRNANQQLRPDPVIPKMNTGPWNQTTMDENVSQVPIEIGM